MIGNDVSFYSVLIAVFSRSHLSRFDLVFLELSVSAITQRASSYKLSCLHVIKEGTAAASGVFSMDPPSAMLSSPTLFIHTEAVIFPLWLSTLFA